MYIRCLCNSLLFSEKSDTENKQFIDKHSHACLYLAHRAVRFDKNIFFDRISDLSDRILYGIYFYHDVASGKTPQKVALITDQESCVHDCRFPGKKISGTFAASVPHKNEITLDRASQHNQGLFLFTLDI